MGFGFGKKRKVRAIGTNRVRPVDRNGRRTGVGSGMVKPIDTPIFGVSGTTGRVGSMVRPIDRPIGGMSGKTGRVGRPVKSINKRTKGADDIFGSGF